MTLPVDWGDESFEFECFDNHLSKLLSAVILQGTTYPDVDFVRDARVVLDVGANIGAASCYFAKLYPDAVVYAFEPAERPRALLMRNTTRFGNVRVEPFGLFSTDIDLPLYQGDEDSVSASIVQNADTTSEVEVVALRSITGWLEEHGIERIDVLKLDTEGCEIPILRALGPRVAAIPIVHVEYHNDDDRRELDDILGATHVVVAGRVLQVHRGELTYVNKAAFPSPEDLERSAIRLSSQDVQPG